MNDEKIVNTVKTQKPVYVPKPIKPQTAPNDDLDKFFTEDDRR